MDPIIAPLLILAGILLLVHHGWKHFFEEEPSTARQESCVWVCYFQPKDISHYETWSVISLTNSFWCVVDTPFDPLHATLAVWFFVLGVLLLFLSFLGCAGSFGCVFHNVCNHETWILVCFTGAANLLLLN